MADISDLLLKFLIAQYCQFRTGDDLICWQANLPGYSLSSSWIVSSYHHHSNPGRIAFLNRLRNAWPHRVFHSYQAQKFKLEVVLSIGQIGLLE